MTVNMHSTWPVASPQDAIEKGVCGIWQLMGSVPSPVKCATRWQKQLTATGSHVLSSHKAGRMEHEPWGVSSQGLGKVVTALTFPDSSRNCTISSKDHASEECNFNCTYLLFLLERNDCYFLCSFNKGKSSGCGEGMTNGEGHFEMSYPQG